MSWFSTSREDFSKKELEVRQKFNFNKTFRFRLNSGDSGKITLLDDVGFYLAEHEVGGKTGPREYFTCTGEEGKCPFCEEGKVPSFVLVGTIINHSEYTTKKGVVLKNRKQLLVLKGKAKRAFEKLKDKHKGSMKYALLEADRDESQTSCATGESFDYLGKLSEEKLLKFVPEGVDAKDFLAPYNYEEILAPRDAQQQSSLSEEPTARSIGSSEEEDPFADLVEPEDSTEQEIKDLDDLI